MGVWWSFCSEVLYRQKMCWHVLRWIFWSVFLACSSSRPIIIIQREIPGLKRLKYREQMQGICPQQTYSASQSSMSGIRCNRCYFVVNVEDRNARPKRLLHVVTTRMFFGETSNIYIGDTVAAGAYDPPICDKSQNEFERVGGGRCPLRK